MKETGEGMVVVRVRMGTLLRTKRITLGGNKDTWVGIGLIPKKVPPAVKIRKTLGAVRNWLGNNAVPSNVPAEYIVPEKSLKEFDELCANANKFLRHDMEELTRDYADEIDRHIRENIAILRANGLNIGAEDVGGLKLKSISVEYQVLSIANSPAVQALLNAVGNDILKARIEENISRIEEEARQNIIEKIHQTTEAMINSLGRWMTARKNGDRSAFHKSLVDHVNASWKLAQVMFEDKIPEDLKARLDAIQALASTMSDLAPEAREVIADDVAKEVSDASALLRQAILGGENNDG